MARCGFGQRSTRPAEMRADWAEFATMTGAEITAIREM